MGHDPVQKVELHQSERSLGSFCSMKLEHAYSVIDFANWSRLWCLGSGSGQSWCSGIPSITALPSQHILGLDLECFRPVGETALRGLVFRVSSVCRSNSELGHAAHCEGVWHSWEFVFAEIQPCFGVDHSLIGGLRTSAPQPHSLALGRNQNWWTQARQIQIRSFHWN